MTMKIYFEDLDYEETLDTRGKEKLLSLYLNPKTNPNKLPLNEFVDYLRKKYVEFITEKIKDS